MLLALLSLSVACGRATDGSATLSEDDRQTATSALVAIGARVTANSPEAVYLSLRNTHVEMREAGGVVEANLKQTRDVRDFAQATFVATRPFLAASEVEEFKTWMDSSLRAGADNVTRSQYAGVRATLSRTPLRFNFSKTENESEY